MNKRGDLDDLLIYKAYVDMMFYFYNLVHKYPRCENGVLVCDIKSNLNEGIKYIIYAQKCFDSRERISFLNKLDASLKTLKVYIRISYRKKYISSKNYGASCRKITNVSNLMFGWMKACQKR
ncbi:MAG: four helix bundle protein [bacterium]|nr:four helix bundle protein [bacterium]